MWLASHHRRSDTASGQAPFNQTKHIDKFIHDGRTVFYQHGSNSYGAWCEGKRPQCKREFSYRAFQVSARLTTAVMAYVSFFASFERMVVQKISAYP